MKSDQFEIITCKKPVAEFILKIYSILEKNQLENIISWSQNGTEIHIKNIKALQEQVLPQYFRHKKLESFIRQLNMYRFSKVNKVSKEKNHMFFKNELFQKGNINALTNIKRKKKGNETPENEQSENQTQTIEGYTEFVKQNVKLLHVELQRLIKNYPQLKQQLMKVQQLTCNLIGEQPEIYNTGVILATFPDIRTHLNLFQTFPQITKMNSIQHFDSRCSIDRDIGQQY